MSGRFRRDLSRLKERWELLQGRAAAARRRLGPAVAAVAEVDPVEDPGDRAARSRLGDRLDTRLSDVGSVLGAHESLADDVLQMLGRERARWQELLAAALAVEPALAGLPEPARTSGARMVEEFRAMDASFQRNAAALEQEASAFSAKMEAQSDRLVELRKAARPARSTVNSGGRR